MFFPHHSKGTVNLWSLPTAAPCVDVSMTTDLICGSSYHVGEPIDGVAVHDTLLIPRTDKVVHRVVNVGIIFHAHVDAVVPLEDAAVGDGVESVRDCALDGGSPPAFRSDSIIDVG
jgi:hypothetical protein